MRQVIAVVWQSLVLFVAALVGFLVGISVPALRVYREVSHTATNVRTYDFDWLIAVFLMYLLLLAIGAATKRARSMAITATISLVIVIAGIALLTQLGIKNTGL